MRKSLKVTFCAEPMQTLLPMAFIKGIPTNPGELLAKFQTGFYGDPTDAIFKVLRVQ